MNKLYISCLFTTLLFGEASFAAGADGNSFKPMSSEICRINNVSTEDSYYIPAQMPAGKFKGECLNVTEMRNLYLLNDINSKNLKVANFYHNNKFWIAKFPNLKNIKQTIFQVEYFPPEWIAAHTQMRFDFTDNSTIQLTAQDGSGEKAEVKSFVISFEAVRRVGFPKYDLIKGLQKHFGMAGRMFSLQNAYEKIVETQHHENDQVLLNYNQEQKENLLRFLVQLGNQNKNHIEVYDTLENNCTTKLYEAIEAITPMPLEKVYIGPKKTVPVMRKKYHTFSFLPSTAVKHLKVREVFEKLLPSFEDEFLNINEIE